MRNVRSFLGLDAGLVGCVRRLEINDKYYNLEAAMHGGDITAGLDICEYWSGPGAGGEGFDFLVCFPSTLLSSNVTRICLASSEENSIFVLNVLVHKMSLLCIVFYRTLHSSNSLLYWKYADLAIA